MKVYNQHQYSVIGKQKEFPDWEKLKYIDDHSVKKENLFIAAVI